MPTQLLTHSLFSAGRGQGIGKKIQEGEKQWVEIDRDIALQLPSRAKHI